MAKAEEGFFIRPILPDDQLSSAGYYHIGMKPGESRTFQIAIKNETNEQLNVAVNAANAFSNPFGSMNYSDSETTETSQFLDDSYKLRDMVEVQETVKVGPNEEKEVKFTVTIPENLSNGQLLGAIQFTAKTSESHESTNNKETSFGLDIKQRYTIGILVELPNKSNSEVALGKSIVSLKTAQPQILTQVKNLNPTITKGLVFNYEVFKKNSDNAMFEGETELPNLAPVTTLDFPVNWNHPKIEYGEYIVKGTLYDKESGSVITEIANELELKEEKLDEYNEQFGETEGQKPTVVSSDKWPWLWLILLIICSYIGYRYGKTRKEQQVEKEHNQN